MRLPSQALRAALLAPTLLAAASCRSAETPEPRLFRKRDVDWSKYAVVYVEEVSVETTANPDEKVDATLRDLKLLAEISLSDALTNTGRFERVTSRKDDVEPGRTLLCRCAMKVHFGSTALRMTFGFGAGRSGLWMSPSLHDAETGEEFLAYRGWGGSFRGWGWEILEKMRHDIPEIADYFASLLPQGP